MENIFRALLNMKDVPENVYWTLHLLTYVKELHGLLLSNGIVRQCLERIYHIPVNAEHVNTITPLLRIIGNLITEETGQVGLELLHEWDTTVNLAEKLLTSCYQYLHNEFLWMIGNILNHPAPIIQDTLKSKYNELMLLEQRFL